MQNTARSLPKINTYKNLLFLLTGLSLLLSAAASAASNSDFDKGMRYFKQGHYNKAIQSFEQAHQKGMRKPALYYNLGVSYFKKGNYDKAETNFKQTLKNKNLKSLSEYNIGLVYLKKGDKTDAKKWFKKSAASSNKKIAGLSRLQLEKLSPRKTGKKTKNWYNYASLSYGYNSNIKLAPVEIASNTNDSYMDIYASTSGVISGSYNDGVLLDAFAYFLNYADVDTYDEKQVRIGLYKNKKYADWRTRLGGYYERSTFGSTDYQQTIGLEARGKKRLGKTNSLSLRYRYNDISSLNAVYDYLNGWRQQFRFEYLDYTASDSKRIYYEIEFNDRQNLSNRNYSPTRHKILAIYRKNLSRAWRIGGELSYRYSAYDPTPVQNREDDRLRAAIEARYTISKMWKVNGRYQRTDNSSTDNLYDYTQNLYYLSVEANF